MDSILDSFLFTLKMFAALPFVLIFATIAIWIDERKDTKNMTYVEFLGWRDVYTEGTENVGYSYGTNGELRAYYGPVRRYAGQEAVFYVEYTDKKPRRISVREYSGKFKVFKEFLEKQNIPQKDA